MQVISRYSEKITPLHLKVGDEVNINNVVVFNLKNNKFFATHINKKILINKDKTIRKLNYNLLDNWEVKIL